MANSISNSDDVIDSRDIIERVDELRSTLESEYEDLKTEFEESEEDWYAAENPNENLEEWQYDNFPEEVIDLEEDCPPKLVSFDVWVEWVESNNNHLYQDEATEFLVLQKLVEQCEGYGDWEYGETLIRDSYFEDYAREMAEDCGFIKQDVSWPYNHIDWASAAQELQCDYTSVDFDGVTYWMRS